MHLEVKKGESKGGAGVIKGNNKRGLPKLPVSISKRLNLTHQTTEILLMAKKARFCPLSGFSDVNFDISKMAP